MKGVQQPAHSTQDGPVGENVPVSLSNCPRGSREEPALTGSVVSVSPLSGLLNPCPTTTGQGAPERISHPSPASLFIYICVCRHMCVRACMCMMLVELGWAAWQKGVGHPGPVESSPVLQQGELACWFLSPYMAPSLGTGRLVPFTR